MDTSYIYKNVDKSSKEYLRSFITFYYYLLLNNNTSYKKEYVKYYGSEKHYDFFVKEIVNKNILIFTLFNQIPMSFLPYPMKKLYYKFPTIIFYKNSDTVKELCVKNKKLISINDFYHSFKQWDKDYPSDRVIEEFSKKLAEGKNDNYDNFRIRINTKFIKNIPHDFINKKLIVLYTNKLIVTDNYQFNSQSQEFIIYKHFFKNIDDSVYKNGFKTTIKFSDINYLSILDTIDKEKMINAFSSVTVKKDAILYNRRYAWPEENNMDFFKQERYPTFFTFNKNERVHDPLKLTKNKYRISEYLLKEDVKVLDLTTNILFRNEIRGNNKKKYSGPDYRKEKDGQLEDEIFRCIGNGDLKEKIEDCDVNFLYKFNKFEYEPNYNLKLGFNLIMFKNLKYMDKSMNISTYLANIGFIGYISNFSFLKLKNDKNEQLSTELVFIYKDDLQQKKCADRLKQLTKYKLIDDKV
jgi:hypothetical protein